MMLDKPCCSVHSRACLYWGLLRHAPIETSPAVYGAAGLVAESDTAYVIGTNVNFNNKVVVTIRGTRPGDVSTSVQNLDRDL